MDDGAADAPFDYSLPPAANVIFSHDAKLAPGRTPDMLPIVLTKKGRRRAYARTPRGRRMLAKRRSLFRDAMNWRRMRAKVFNRLYMTYGRSRRYGARKSYRRRRYYRK